MSKCGKCQQPGHNARSCVTKEREAIKKPKGKPERLEIEGVIPKKGLWIIHEEKSIVVGKIRKIAVSGKIHYTAVSGAQVKTAQEDFLKGGYTYTEIEPSHLKWKLGLV